MQEYVERILAITDAKDRDAVAEEIRNILKQFAVAVVMDSSFQTSILMSEE